MGFDTAGWMDGWMDGWLVGWLVGWMDGWLVGWLVGWMDGWLDIGFWESVDYSPLCLQVRFLILSVGCKGRYVCSIVLLTCLEHGR